MPQKTHVSTANQPKFHPRILLKTLKLLDRAQKHFVAGQELLRKANNDCVRVSTYNPSDPYEYNDPYWGGYWRWGTMALGGIAFQLGDFGLATAAAGQAEENAKNAKKDFESAYDDWKQAYEKMYQQVNSPPHN